MIGFGGSRCLWKGWDACGIPVALLGWYRFGLAWSCFGIGLGGLGMAWYCLVMDDLAVI